MKEVAKHTKLIRLTIIVVLAILLASLIFIVDINMPLGISIGTLYCIVILYSWLLPGNFSPIYVAVICTILITLGAVFSISNYVSDFLVETNRIISIVVVWICAVLVAVAKKSFRGLNVLNDNLKKSISELEETKLELNIKIEALKAEKKKSKASQEELENFNLQLKAKNDELEQFAYVASHDLQEPLRVIMNFAEILKMEYNDKIDETTTKSVEFIHSAAHRMSRKIKGLLEYSLIGKLHDYEVVDANKIVGNVISDLDTKIKESKAQIVVENLPHVNVKVEDIRMVFMNLINNSIKYRDKKKQLKIEVGAVDDGDKWKFYIRDNGIGVDSKHFSRIFVIFQKLFNKEEYEGSGIGLSHCKKVIEQHKGTIWIESKLEEGSTFYFTLPKK